MIYDVIIVGAGPGGSAAAIVLARLGWDVLLLEKHTFPRDKVCGDLISPRSLRILQQLGCLEAIAQSASNRLEGGILYVNGQKITEAKIPRVDGLPNYGYALPRLIFDEIVFRQAQMSGAQTVEGCAVTGLTFAEEWVTVRAMHNRQPRDFRGKLVIGADGAHSVVAQTLGMEQRDSKSIIVALRAYFDGVSGDPSLVDLFFDEDFFPGYGWIFHLGNGRANVGLGMVQDVYARHDISLRKAFDRWIAADKHARERLGKARLDGRIVGWPLNTYRRNGLNYAERTLLIGDAGSFVDPINGEGIHTALETALLAAGVADDALRAEDFSAAFLARYADRWRATLDLDMQTSDLIVAIIQNRALTPFFMFLLNLIGERAGRDLAYANTCGGILAGVVPAHHSLSPIIMTKTLLHGSGFWERQLEMTSDGGLKDIVNSGLLAGSTLLDILSEMAQEPAHTASWSLRVAGKGLGLLGSLGDKYLLGTARYMLGNYLADRPPSGND
jgi:geranylgeranyl reductase family protein